MSLLPFRLALFLLPAAVALSAAGPTNPAPAPAKKAEHSKFVFSLLPKSLQANPRLNLNVITELSAEGKKLPRPTAENPTYYLLQPGGYMKLGDGVAANEKAPPPVELERLMEKSLADSHYLPSSLPNHPPSIVLIFHWGSHSTQDDEQDSEDPAAPPPMGGDKDAEAILPQVMADLAKMKMLFERASIVGGNKFAGELMQAIKEEGELRAFEATAARAAAAAGNSAPTAAGALRPFARFRDRDDETLQLVEDSFSSCYYVIVSAIDYRSVATKEKVLLWRTKMTVNSLGVSFVDTAPALIFNAGEYFGREMAAAVTTSQRAAREGRVNIGTPTVVPEPADTPAPSAPETRKP